MLFEQQGQVGDGGNSGFQCLNLVAQMAPQRIVLVGFDMRLDKGVHWHGWHEGHLGNPRNSKLPRWRRALDGAAALLTARGVEVLNASPVSTLTAYEMCDIEKVFP